MFTARALLLALAALGAEAFSASPVGASRLTAARTARQSVSMGTFVEELKFKRFFNRFTFATFSDCIVAAGLEEELAKGDHTLFAPTDKAFEELGEAALAEIMADKPRLQNLVKFHMMEGLVDGPSFRDSNGKKLKMMQGGELLVDADGRTAYVNDAKVETYDVKTDQGIFHIIDWVNAPK